MNIHTVVRRDPNHVTPLFASTVEADAETFYDKAEAANPATSHLLEIVSFDLSLVPVVAVDAFELDDFSEATR
jgi:hypothetical protein